MTRSIQYLLAAILLSVTFSAPVFAAADGEVYDPFEGANRVIFKFNNGLDVVLLEPIAKGYNYAVPQYARDRVHHVLLNLDEPLSTVNYLLQARFDDSAQSLIRFMVNSTFGVAGIFDVTGDQSDDKVTGFGDTFARWGAGPGPYLVLPLVGPSDLRDTAGLVADYYGDPVALTIRGGTLDVHNPETTLDIIYGVETLDARSRLVKQIDDLRKNSLDFYAAIRSIYMQRRAAHLGDKGQAAADAPDFN